MSDTLMVLGYLSTSLGWARVCRHTRAMGCLVAETEKLFLWSAWKNSIPQSIRRGNLISTHFLLAPHHFKTLCLGHVWGWSWIPYKYQRHRTAERHSRSWGAKSDPSHGCTTTIPSAPVCPLSDWYVLLSWFCGMSMEWYHSDNIYLLIPRGSINILLKWQ